MKILTLIISLFAFSLATTNAENENSKKLAASVKLWTKIKAECSGDYSYQVVKSYMMGNRNVTYVIVRNNLLTERNFVTVSAKGEEKLVFHERGKTVGSNKQGAVGMTMDEMHAYAAKMLTAKIPDMEKLYMRFDKNGLLSACYTVNTMIADDAPMKGFAITNFAADVPAKTKTPAKDKPTK